MPERYIHPEDGMVFACSNCDHAGDIYERKGAPQTLDDHRFRCYTCCESFDVVVDRESKASGATAGCGSELASTLLEMNADDLGAGPA